MFFLHIAHEGLHILSIPFYQPVQEVFTAIFAQLIPFSQQQGMMDADSGNKLLSSSLAFACLGQECLDFWFANDTFVSPDESKAPTPITHTYFQEVPSKG